MKIRLALLLGLTVLLLGCAQPPPPQPAKIPALQTQTTTANSIRLTAIQETAMSVGAQGGLAYRTHKLNAVLKSQEAYLNQIFNFNALILKNNVLPPVLAEGNMALNLADNNTLRLADKVYKIVQPPRFITTPPSWRDYLWTDYPPPDSTNATLLPKTEQEREIWNKYVQIGWHDGITQADQIFSANLGRLRRDYSGMILYRKLLDQNIVTAPYVAKLNLGITGGGRSMRINDQVLRITATSQLNPNGKTWKPVVTKGEVDGVDEDADQAAMP